MTMLGKDEEEALSLHRFTVALGTARVDSWRRTNLLLIPLQCFVPPFNWGKLRPDSGRNITLNENVEQIGY
jgi:hypothetical protein